MALGLFLIGFCVGYFQASEDRVEEGLSVALFFVIGGFIMDQAILLTLPLSSNKDKSDEE